METLKNIMLGLVPVAVQFSQDIVTMSIQNNRKYFPFNDVNKVDSGEDKKITIDFSTVHGEGKKHEETFDLEIDKHVGFTPKRKLRRVEINYRFKLKNEGTEYRTRNEDGCHKGLGLGQMIDDFIKDNQKVVFKGLSKTDTFNYDRPQPDFMLAQIFMFAYKVPFRKICLNYADPKWFMGVYGLPGTPSFTSSPKEIYKMSKSREGRFKLYTLYFVDNYDSEERAVRSAYALTMMSGVFSGKSREDIGKTKFVDIKKR